MLRLAADPFRHKLGWISVTAPLSASSASSALRPAFPSRWRVITRCTTCAAVRAMRRARHDGQKPRRLQLKATSLSVAVVTATQAQEAVGQDAALPEGVELVLHKLRQVGAGCGLGLLEESRGVLLHQAVQRGLICTIPIKASCTSYRPNKGRRCQG